MIFHATQLTGVRLVELQPNPDDRGFFARIWCRDEFVRAGLDPELSQESLSHNRLRGTLRGLHFQRPPYEETKLVRCVRGAIFDVVVDIRPDSPTYLRWQGFAISAANRLAVYIPKGFAHGFQVLEDDTDVLYGVSTPYNPAMAAGYRYDDARIAITWPLALTVISERDLAWPPVPNRNA